MTDQPKCRCGRPIHDMAYACRACGSEVVEALAGLAALAGTAVDTIAKLDAVNRIGAILEPPEPEPKAESALYPNPLPPDLDAAERYDAAVMELITWARHVEEERGVLASIDKPCQHRSCASAAQRLVVGSPCGQHPLRSLALFLTEHLDWLRHRPEGVEALDGLRNAAAAITAVVDRPADRWFAGLCDDSEGCGAKLWPASGVTTIRCDCGLTYSADERRGAMLAQLAEVWLGAEQCAHALVMLGKPANASTIRTWAERGRLAPHPDSLPGRPRYRVGSVRELVEEAHAEQAERRLRAAVRAEEARERKAKKREMMSA